MSEVVRARTVHGPMLQLHNWLDDNKAAQPGEAKQDCLTSYAKIPSIGLGVRLALLAEPRSFNHQKGIVVKRIGRVRNRKAVRVSALARLLLHRSDRPGARIIQEADHVQAYDKLGGLLAEECELLARHCRGEADRFDRMAEAEPENITWPGFANWMRERARLFTEWEAEESLRQDQFAREQRTAVAEAAHPKRRGTRDVNQSGSEM